MLIKLLIYAPLLLLLLVSCEPAISTPAYSMNTEIPALNAKEIATSDSIDQETAFKQMFPLQELNTKMKFLPMEEKFNITNCDQQLGVENLSDRKFIFSFDEGLKILLFNDGKWKYVPDTVQYIPSGNYQIFPTRPDQPGIRFFFLCPDMTGYDLPKQIRVVLVGFLESSSTEKEEQVGAYTDIWVDQ